ncbi:hypothetical protein V5T82_03745 [Magnetovibrio sp. PR-2]|uniref:hypothetical protein n=1 Tax=Magnetovibrio sp. PR-2 TaxID=3120356 RepID=UPI002FCE0AB1
MTTIKLNRRQLLKAGLGTAGGLVLAGVAWAEENATKLETLQNLHVAFVNRATGKVEFVKTFAETNPEILSGKTSRTPYRPPSKNVWLGRTGTLFQRDVKRYGIVDIEKRNEGLGFFSSLKDSYTPEEYTHHFLLTLTDRELGREEIGGWALANATDTQKKAALDLLYSIHKGTNGRYVTDDPEKMAEATRYYTGRELLKPSLYIGNAPSVGAQAFIPQSGIQVASTEAIQLALASGAVTGGVDVGAGAANDMSVAAEGATEGTVSSVAAAIGGAAGVGASAGGASDSGDGGSGSGGGDSGGSSSGGSGAGGSGAGK